MPILTPDEAAACTTQEEFLRRLLSRAPDTYFLQIVDEYRKAGVRHRLGPLHDVEAIARVRVAMGIKGPDDLAWSRRVKDFWLPKFQRSDELFDMPRHELAALPDKELLGAAYVRKGDEFADPAAPYPVRILGAVHWLDAEVCNGGYDQYFFNGGEATVDFAVEGLRAIGATAAAELTSQAARVVRERYPGGLRRARSAERSEQERRYRGPDPDLEALTNEYFALAPEDPLTGRRRRGSIHRELAAYVRAHLDAF